jgi:hypothetical protein
MRAALLLLALAGCDLEGSCETVEQTGPGMSGVAVYTLGDGSRLEADLDRASARTRTDGIEMLGELVDQWGIEKLFSLRLDTIEPGTYDLAARDARVCMERRSGDLDDVCTPLTGTLELRAFVRDCYWHSSGIGSCAETLDFTLAARSNWQTTVFTIDAAMLTQGAWVDDPDSCAD